MLKKWGCRRLGNNLRWRDGNKSCKIKRKDQIRLLKFFVAEVTARDAANILGFQANTVALFYRKVRQIIIENLPDITPEQEKFEADESYFGGVRKDKQGRGAAGKIPVFAILKRGGKVYTKVVADTKSQTLFATLKTKLLSDSSDFKHYRINHRKLFAHKHTHINGIENFWSQDKRVLRKYNGLPRKNFHLFLKKCEFRFNYGSPKQQLEI